MNPNSEVERYCQLVLADTTLKKAQQRRCGVEMPLIIPQRKLKGSQLESLGGYLGVPLREMRLGAGKPPFVVDDYLGEEKVRAGEEVSLVLDSGSQGFWVMDFGEGKNGESITEASSLGTLVGDYELVCGKRGGPTFTIRIPQQWRDFQGANDLLSMKPNIVKGQGLQCLIVGNPFLQAVALTFDVSRMMAVLSHLDVDGNRCAEYQGPKSIVSKEQSALAAQPPNIRSNRLPIKDGKLVLPSLAQSSLSTSAPEKDTVPIATDVALDLRFMTYPSSTETSLVSVETRKATDLILPCLDVVVSNAQGARVFMSQIFDTGSGVNLLMDIDMSTTEVCPAGQCFCERGGLVGNALGKTSLLGGNSSSCGPCNQPNVGSKQGNGGGICNSYCCTPEGVSCDSEMPCSVTFCTGVVSYQPRFVTMSFPSENVGDGGALRLGNVQRVFAGSAQPTCVPGVNTGLFGAWFWDAPLVGSSGKNTSSKAAGIPYYLLGAIGQIGGENENYTLKFWRSDLKKAKETVALGQKFQKNNPKVPMRPWWANHSNPPAESPSPVEPPSSPTSSPPASSPFPPSAPPTQASPSVAQPPTFAASPSFADPPSFAASPSFADPPSFAASPGFAPPTPVDRKTSDSWNISEGAAYSQNRDGGTQQIVIIETDWGNETRARHNRSKTSGNPLEAEPEPLEPNLLLRNPADAPGPETLRSRSNRSHGPVPETHNADWVLRGLAIAGIAILAILLVVVVGRRRERGSEGYEDAYVMNSDTPTAASLQT